MFCYLFLISYLLRNQALAELSSPGDRCNTNDDCAGGLSCLPCGNTKGGGSGDTTSAAWYRITPTDVVVGLLSSTFYYNSGRMFVTSESCNNPTCDLPDEPYECPTTGGSPSVLIEWTWPGCNKNNRPFPPSTSCTSYGDLNSITGLYQKTQDTLNGRPVYRRQNPTATGAILFLFYKSDGFSVIADTDGILGTDPSDTTGVAFVKTNAMYIEDVAQESDWTQGRFSSRILRATMTCSKEVYTGGNSDGGGTGGGDGGGGGGTGGGNCNPGCCLSCNMSGCPKCCC